ncbi:helix-turn-helix transcriptional regulator [Promicromonospora thailandica]|uniref:Helix-turn-helix domain-containing protein n=1 Tax=Promicromonospora thailandica TaxID=765201 RepID=A0A9X2JXK0_9MICO|nr:helix-turn-helix transcriptional regulator [Promicromonospora thailandica]MCP2266642.1 Helix-turn-helix domain-containing protein [Promicromonospora thailandica]BFF17281.1 helix-turn-helix transcriptional regulator [Promicromonospora thailandica]
MNRPALADFLRRRREALRPSDVGLVPGPRRRAPGLRREEVAALTGMSVDYYARLEQQRGPQPSEQMLAALTRALRLTVEERDYLFRLAGHGVPRRTPLDTHVAPALLRVLDRLEDAPAFILSGLGEVLVQNRLAEAVFGTPPATGLARSTVYRWFTDPRTRDVYPPEDHERQGRTQVANLRAALAAAGPGSFADELLQALLRESEEFVRVWELHEVSRRFEQHKTLVHPELGRIDVDCQALFTEDQSQALVVLTPAPGSEAEEKIRLLAVLGHEAFA